MEHARWQGVRVDPHPIGSGRQIVKAIGTPGGGIDGGEQVVLVVEKQHGDAHQTHVLGTDATVERGEVEEDATGEDRTVVEAKVGDHRGVGIVEGNRRHVVDDRVGLGDRVVAHQGAPVDRHIPGVGVEAVEGEGAVGAGRVAECLVVGQAGQEDEGAVQPLLTGVEPIGVEILEDRSRNLVAALETPVDEGSGARRVRAVELTIEEAVFLVGGVDSAGQGRGVDVERQTARGQVRNRVATQLVGERLTHDLAEGDLGVNSDPGDPVLGSEQAVAIAVEPDLTRDRDVLGPGCGRADQGSEQKHCEGRPPQRADRRGVEGSTDVGIPRRP